MIIYRALTPVGSYYSASLFIGIRFIMGLMQCILCVYLPLWVHEYAPSTQRAKCMGALQGSVPFGVMIGYIIAAVLVEPTSNKDMCYGLLCWRWPLLVEWALLLPFCFALIFVPTKHFDIRNYSRLTINDKTSNSAGYGTMLQLPDELIEQEELDFEILDTPMKAQSFATVEQKIYQQEQHIISKSCEVSFRLL